MSWAVSSCSLTLPDRRCHYPLPPGVKWRLPSHLRTRRTLGYLITVRYFLTTSKYVKTPNKSTPFSPWVACDFHLRFSSARPQNAGKALTVALNKTNEHSYDGHSYLREGLDLRLDDTNIRCLVWLYGVSLFRRPCVCVCVRVCLCVCVFILNCTS